MSSQMRMVAIGSVTVALYVLRYCAQSTIFHNETHTSVASGNLLKSGLAWQLLDYEVITTALFDLYPTVLSMARRGELNSGRTLTSTILVSCFINLLLLPARPWLSPDRFSYMAHG